MDERAVFERLGVFAGGCTLEAAEAVAATETDVLDALTSLVDNSLLRRLDERFVMLETVREFAAERLEQSGEAERVCRLHAEHFAAFAERIAAALRAGEGPEESHLRRLDSDHDKIRAALAWANETGELELELRIAVAVQWYWNVRGEFGEARRVFDGLIERTEASEPRFRAAALVHGALFPYRQGETERARALWEEALELFRSLGDEEGVARSVAELGTVAFSEGDFELARALFEEGVKLFRAQGNRIRLAIALGNLGAAATMEGDHETAARYQEEAAAIQRENGDRDGLAVTLHNLGRSLLAGGRLDDSRTAITESIALAWTLGYRELIGYCLAAAAEFALADRELEQAARFAAGAAAIFREIGVPIAGEEAEAQMRTASRLRAELDPERLEQLRAEGEKASVDELISAFAPVSR